MTPIKSHLEDIPQGTQPLPDATAPSNNNRPDVFSDLVDAKAAGKFLKLHPKTVIRYAEHGVIPGRKIGSAWRFRISLLDEYTRTSLSSCCHPLTHKKGAQE